MPRRTSIRSFTVSRHLIAAATALAVGLVQPVGGREEITVWTTRAIATVLAVIGSDFERETGHTLTISSDLPTAFERRVTAA